MRNDIRMVEKSHVKTSNSDLESNGREYTLLLTKDVFSELRKLSVKYARSDSIFVAILVKRRFEWMKADISDEQLSSFIHYLDRVESIRGVQYKNQNKEDTKSMKVFLPDSLLNVIEIFCKMINWKTKQFIEDTIEFWIDPQNGLIDCEKLNFLNWFFDFNPLLTAIDDLHDLNYRITGVEP